VSNDKRRLAETAAYRRFSKPQGRVLALMHLLPHSSGVIAICRASWFADPGRAAQVRAPRQGKNRRSGELLSVAGQHTTAPLQSAGYTDISAATREEGVGVAAVNRDPGRYWVIGLQETGGVRTAATSSRGTDRTCLASRGYSRRSAADISATREAFVAQC